MNLIEVSEQLKDVPDQYLMREVQQPTGNYPAYLVISELSRRKRMRESAMKEAPTTSVAEDLTQPAQSPQAPAGRLNAGIGALPGAQQSLAAQDVMAQEPVRMAGGGTVYAADGLPSSFFDTDIMGNPVIQDDLQQRQKEYEAEEAYRRYLKGQQQMSDIFSGKTPLDTRLAESRVGKKGLDLFMKERMPEPEGPVKTTGTTAAPGKPAATAAVDPYTGMIKTSMQGLMAMKPPTDAELLASRAAGRSEFEREVPYRLGFLEEDIAKRGADIAGRRESNINEALMQAGLGVMGSKSPRFLQAVSEGGLSALGAYRQGVKDIRSSEEALLNSKIEMAKAQSLYDKDKFGAGKEHEQKSIENWKRGLDLANTQNAALVRTQEAAQKGPYYGALTQQALANAEYLKSGKGKSAISDADQAAADKFASAQLAMKGILPGSPQYLEEYKKQFNSYLGQIRGGPAGAVSGSLPQGWSVEQH